MDEADRRRDRRRVAAAVAGADGRSSSAAIGASLRPAQAALCRARCSRPACPRSRSPSGRRSISPPTRRRRRHVVRLRHPRADVRGRSRPPCSASGRSAGRLPAPIPGLYPVGHGLTDGPAGGRWADEPARRDPRAAGRRRAPRRARRRRSRPIAERASRAPRRRARGHRRPRHLRPRRDLRASTCSGSGCGLPVGARDAVDRCRSTASSRGSAATLVIGISQSGASPDIVGVRRERRAARGVPTIAITNEPGLGARARRGARDRPRRRAGAGGRGDQDVHRRARGHRPARRPRSAGGRRSRPTRRSTASRRRSTAALATEAAAREAAATSRAVAHVRRASAAATSTRRPASGRSSSRSSPASSPTRTRPRTSATGRSRWSSAGYPVLAIAPSGGPGRRPRRACCADPRRARRATGRACRTARTARARPAVRPAARRRRRPPRCRSCRSCPASCSPTTRPGPRATTPTRRGTSARSRSRAEPLWRCPGR